MYNNRDWGEQDKKKKRTVRKRFQKIIQGCHSKSSVYLMNDTMIHKFISTR